MDKSYKSWGSLTNQQWEINFIVNLVCALTNLIGIGPGPRPKAKKYRAGLGRVGWLHVILIPWNKAQCFCTSPARLSAGINGRNAENFSEQGFASLKNLAIIIKLSLKFFFSSL